MNVDVRRAAQGDLTEILTLVEEYCAADSHPFDVEVARRGVEPMLADDRLGAIWLAVDDGHLAGYAAVTWGWSIEVGGLDVVLDEIYVRDRGRGLGSRLLDHVHDDCRDRGVRRVFLETELDNDGARRLYARHGYESDTSIWMSKEFS